MNKKILLAMLLLGFTGLYASNIQTEHNHRMQEHNHRMQEHYRRMQEHNRRMQEHNFKMQEHYRKMQDPETQRLINIGKEIILKKQEMEPNTKEFFIKTPELCITVTTEYTKIIVRNQISRDPS